ncbi:EAL domain-containing protein [Halomonas sp. THAF12]|uniref:EAL domain-containing protein n=1 Tax=Halomonas sp. B23F22_10 TaxID=3459515 RepID=UPI00373E47E5
MAHCARVTGHCRRCEGALPFDFTMAFQPIVDVNRRHIHAYEALVRGASGEPAGQVLDSITDAELYRFDQACRVKAIEQASRLGMRESLSINFLPNAVYEPEACLEATLEVSQRVGWPPERLIFEIVESEHVSDRDHLMAIITAYRRHGFRVALDDFGTGYANLDMLADLHPDKLKLDRRLVADCDRDPRRQALIEATVVMACRLGLTLIAEGVETAAEGRWLLETGIGLQQGYYFARPALDALATVPDERFEAIHAAPLPRRGAACR